MKREFPAEARFVSWHAQPKHLATAEKIRSLGGFVGSNARFEKSGAKSIFGQTLTGNLKPDRTVVVLPAEWKGTANDLKLLADLDRFRELYFFDRIVSGEETDVLSELDRFDVHFIRSSISDSDIVKIPVYRHWTLYPHPAGPVLGDATLEAIYQHRIYHDSFVLIGEGFTEKTVDFMRIVAQAGLPRQMRVVGTRIPPEKLAVLRRLIVSTPDSAVRFFDE